MVEYKVKIYIQNSFQLILWLENKLLKNIGEKFNWVLQKRRINESNIFADKLVNVNGLKKYSIKNKSRKLLLKF